MNLNTASSVYCYAPLQLPHGATITNATFYFYDNDDNYLYFDLVRQNQTLLDVMGYVSNRPGSDTPGYANVSLSFIYYATVDNNNYYYWLYVTIPYSSTSSYNYWFQYALIEYAYPP